MKAKNKYASKQNKCMIESAIYLTLIRLVKARSLTQQNVAKFHELRTFQVLRQDIRHHLGGRTGNQLDLALRDLGANVVMLDLHVP